MKRLRLIIQHLVGFGYYHSSRIFEVVQLVSWVDAYVGDVDNIDKAFILFDDVLQMMLG